MSICSGNGEYWDHGNAYQAELDNSSSRTYKRSDVRTRRDRLRALHRNWQDQMPSLTTAYLRWKHSATTATSSEDVSMEESDTFHVQALWTHHRDDKFVVVQRDNELANVSLMHCGLLGCSPVISSVAISLDTLELYHRLRRRHAQLSVQPMVKALCDIHNTTYSAVLREQFSAAFEVYLDILRRVQAMADSVLGHSIPDWWAKHGCPCCNLKLDGEENLRPERLLAMDGNNSAKRIARAGTEDERTFHSDYFLSREEVDRFKDEVKRRVTVSKKDEESELSEDDDAPWIAEEAPGEAPDEQSKSTPCTERWKASAAEHEKCALDTYESTGIFVSACRHGLIQKACEMVRSGEL
ncbi:hypothetical protein OBBRIDRAFT_732569 [Obba rivulosa]|uniref:CxC1-like cysteine cluster associated with KDZ transposases domain-containing protein n=1 Tax=Obba rivulosa TaxID=1052685 RepID=A0A8E2ARA1_9APHY|nr:hypothetical protein OBBRIDRAFT_732569 [Obba rivulosa]